MRRRMALLSVLSAVAVAAALSGCGGHAPGPPASDGLVHDVLTADSISLGDVGVNPRRQRWMDILDTLYGPYSCAVAKPFSKAYNYSQATVNVSYPDVVTTNPMTFTLSGGDLKPNFAYQVKLEGLPEIDGTGNAYLRDVGRSWRQLGYLIFGYFVTNEDGDIVDGKCAAGDLLSDTTFPINSSYHVLWKYSQRTWVDGDGPPIEHEVNQGCYAYGVDPASVAGTEGVFAEPESGRPAPGTLVLPDHTYTCLLRLTEESFHSNDPNGGNWESVLDAVVTFTIGDGGPVGGTMHVGNIDMGIESKGPNVNAVATVLVVDDDDVPVDGATVNGSWTGIVSGSGSAVTDSAGLAVLRSPKVRGASGTFTLTVDALVKAGWTYDSTANAETSDSITVP